MLKKFGSFRGEDRDERVCAELIERYVTLTMLC